MVWLQRLYVKNQRFILHYGIDFLTFYFKATNLIISLIMWLFTDGQMFLLPVDYDFSEVCLTLKCYAKMAKFYGVTCFSLCKTKYIYIFFL